MTKPLLHKYDNIHIYYYNSTPFIILYGYLYLIEQRYNMINQFVAQQLLSLYKNCNNKILTSSYR